MLLSRANVVAIILLILAVLIGAYFLSHVPTPPSKILTSDSPASFQFELADTKEKRVQGLSGRTRVPENYGMLFIFDTPGTYGIWMKDMYVAIDIIWLEEDGTVVHIDRGVSPDTYPKTFYPPSPISYVLETAAGESARQGWDVGNKLPLPL